MRKIEPGWWVRARHKNTYAPAHKFVVGGPWLYPLCAKGEAESREALLPLTEVKEHRHVSFCSLCFDIARTLDVMEPQSEPVADQQAAEEIARLTSERDGMKAQLAARVRRLRKPHEANCAEASKRLFVAVCLCDERVSAHNRAIDLAASEVERD